MVFAASADSALPLAQIEAGQMTGGILFELGQALAQQLHRHAEFLTVPRKRLDSALAAGTVDGICYVLPGWIDAPAHWTPAFLPNEDLVVGGPHVAAPPSVAALAGQLLGTVLGYRYPELENTLGDAYQRDNSPSMPLNIRKLVAGRYHYAAIDRLSLDYHARLYPELKTWSTLMLSHFQAGCAFSQASRLPMNEVDAAIRQLVREGTVRRILAHYQ